MVTARWLAYVTLAVVTSACGTGDEEHCGSIATAFVAVIVTDAVTGERICSADVRVVVGDREFQARPTGTPCEFVSFGGELNAEHSVSVLAAGYKPFAGTVFVPAAECGPVTQTVNVSLERAT
jgi:hypothetical protein